MSPVMAAGTVKIESMEGRTTKICHLLSNQLQIMTSTSSRIVGIDLVRLAIPVEPTMSHKREHHHGHVEVEAGGITPKKGRKAHIKVEDTTASKSHER